MHDMKITEQKDKGELLLFESEKRNKKPEKRLKKGVDKRGMVW